MSALTQEMAEKLYNAITTLNRNTEILSKKKSTAVWVSAHEITKATGWNPERMRRERIAQSIEFKRSKTGGYRYNLNSINEKFIIKQSAA